MTHEIHGLVQRRPAEERMRSAVVAALDQGCGPAWRAAVADPRQPLDEEAACLLALGIRARSELMGSEGSCHYVAKTE